MRHPIKSLLTTGLILMSNAVAAQDVVAVNYPLQFMAEHLLGPSANINFPVPADVDPSFWRPTIADISAIQAADLILLNGAGFATWVDRVSLPRSKVVNTSAAIEDAFITTESITHSHGNGGEHSHEGVATYLWLDPILAIAQAEAVAAAITARDLAPADDVAERLETLTADLTALDADAQDAFDGLQDVTIIATHPRYEYLDRRYDLDIRPLEWESGATPNKDEMATLQVLVEDTGAQILIWEAAPPAGAFEMTTALGLRNVVFAPLAHGVEGKTFIEVYKGAVLELAGSSPQ